MSKKIVRKPPKVWVHADSGEDEYRLLRQCGVDRARNMDDADIFLFVGGADVNPLLYGEEPIRGVNFNTPRDNHDILGWRMAEDKFKIGICRGGQFLNVMNGGKLWQDINNHGRTHDLVDAFTNQKVPVSSTHHQQFRPAQGAITIATARETTYKTAETQRWEYKNNGTPMDNYFAIDHEVLFYPESRSLCFQPHPEYTSPASTAEYFDKVFNKALRGEYTTVRKP